MIEEKLKKARAISTRRKLLLGLGLFGVICLCSLLLIGLSVYDFSEKDHVTAVIPIEETLPRADMEKIREEFKELLQEYENELEADLQRASVDIWNNEAFFNLNELKKKVMLNFSTGDYGLAMDNLQLLKNLTIQVLEEADHLFETNLDKAVSFLAEDLYDEAKFYIEKALQIKPLSPEALRLQNEIEKLPGLLPLLNGAKIARAENDPLKEFNFLQQIQRIVPEREGIDNRLLVLHSIIKTQKFDAHIASGFAYIEKQKAKKARYHYHQAKKIYPQREELLLLYDQLLSLEKFLRVQQAVRLAEQAVRQDDWQQARQYFARAAKDAPEDKRVAEGLSRANHCLDLLARFDRFFKNPYRLAHAQVRSEAQKTLVQAKAASAYSFAIKRSAQKLSQLIARVNQLIPVSVISDDKTYVLVRSVGKVGVFSEKIIQLKPGNYTFEGTRDGFKSKLVKAFIPYDKKDFSVRVICDEPI